MTKLSKSFLLLGVFLYWIFFLVVDSQADPKIHVIEIKRFQFMPTTLTIHVGDIVKWVNNDLVPHNISDANQHQWESPNLEPADSFSLKVLKSTPYFCSFHPTTMKAKITVIN